MNQELKDELELLSGWDIPKCDVLEFLLEKLQSNPLFGLTWRGNQWYAYINGLGSEEITSNTAEECLLILAINLFKEGILTK